MNRLHLHPTATAQWHSLVCEAEAASETRLDESLQSYLVFLLMRFTCRPELASSVMALDFLRALTSAGRLQGERLRDVGDQCLLYSGLYPRRAERRLVRLGYFVDLGRSAYDRLARGLPDAAGDLFQQLCEGFVPLMEVLQTIRDMNGSPALDSLQAVELWQDLRSPRAREQLRRELGTLPPVEASRRAH